MHGRLEVQRFRRSIAMLPPASGKPSAGRTRSSSSASWARSTSSSSRGRGNSRTSATRPSPVEGARAGLRLLMCSSGRTPAVAMYNGRLWAGTAVVAEAGLGLASLPTTRPRANEHRAEADNAEHATHRPPHERRAMWRPRRATFRSTPCFGSSAWGPADREVRSLGEEPESTKPPVVFSAP
jgi:hypothetical protein